MTRATPFVRPLALGGRATGARWGFDPTLECYWAELTAPDGTRVRVGPEHLIVTVDGLSRAIAHAARLAPDEAYLALTA